MICPYCRRHNCCKPDPNEVAELEEELREWKAARRAIAQAQSYTIGKRQLTRASLKEVRGMIKELENDLYDLHHCRGGGAGRGARVITVVPRDTL